MAYHGLPCSGHNHRQRWCSDRLSGLVIAAVGTDFAYVGFAALWGFLFFAEVLDGVTLTGMAMIVLWREFWR